MAQVFQPNWFQRQFTPAGMNYKWEARPDQGGGEFTGYIPDVYEGDIQDLALTEMPASDFRNPLVGATQTPSRAEAPRGPIGVAMGSNGTTAPTVHQTLGTGQNWAVHQPNAVAPSAPTATANLTDEQKFLTDEQKFMFPQPTSASISTPYDSPGSTWANVKDILFDDTTSSRRFWGQNDQSDEGFFNHPFVNTIESIASNWESVPEFWKERLGIEPGTSAMQFLKDQARYTGHFYKPKLDALYNFLFGGNASSNPTNYFGTPILNIPVNKDSLASAESSVVNTDQPVGDVSPGATQHSRWDFPADADVYNTVQAPPVVNADQDDIIPPVTSTETAEKGGPLTNAAIHAREKLFGDEWQDAALRNVNTMKDWGIATGAGTAAAATSYAAWKAGQAAYQPDVRKSMKALTNQIDGIDKQIKGIKPESEFGLNQHQKALKAKLETDRASLVDQKNKVAKQTHMQRSKTAFKNMRLKLTGAGKKALKVAKAGASWSIGKIVLGLVGATGGMATMMLLTDDADAAVENGIANGTLPISATNWSEDDKVSFAMDNDPEYAEKVELYLKTQKLMEMGANIADFGVSGTIAAASEIKAEREGTRHSGPEMWRKELTGGANYPRRLF